MKRCFKIFPKKTDEHTAQKNVARWAMRINYQTLINLKFREGISTYELVRKFPEEINRVSEIALLDVPEGVLREILKEEKLYARVMRLKRKFLK